MSVEVLKQIWPEWQIEGKPLGKGSFGVVYKAVRRDHNLESHAAIKEISIPADPSEVASLRSEGLDENATRTYLQGIVNDFVSEIQLMESLKGVPNIVSVEDYKVVEKTNEIGWDIYIRMELLTSFNAYVCDKKLAEEEIIQLGCDICTALEICAKRNIIHRDIKPENIFINDFGYFKLGDFGIARKMENMTGGLSQKGTFNYMAPEVANSSVYDARVDIYSLGIVLYRLLNGNRLPFLDTEKQLLNPNERRNAVDRRIRGEKLPAPCEASPAMADLILRACAYDPDMRFASATEMKQALMSVANGTYQMAACNLDRTTSVRKAAVDYDKTTAVRKAPNASDKKSAPTVHTFGSKSRKKSKVPAVIAVLLAVILLVGARNFIISKLTGDNEAINSEEKISETVDYSEFDEEQLADIISETESAAEKNPNQNPDIPKAPEEHNITGGSDKANAVSVQKEDLYHASFTAKGTVDWFKFSTSANYSAYSIEILNNSINSNIKVTVYDGYDNEIKRVNVSKGNTKYLDVSLKSNTEYWIKVHRDLNDRTGNYQFAVNEQICDAGMEMEDAFYTDLGVQYTKAFDVSEISDWYRFTTTNNYATYQFRLTNNSVNTALYLTVYDEYNTEMGSVYAPKSESAFLDLILSPNREYTVKLSRYHNDENGYYQMCIAEMICDSGLSQAEAFPLEVNKEFNGTADTSFSEWYTYTIPRNGKYTLHLTNNSVDTTIFAKVYDVLGTELGSIYATENNTSKRSLEIAAGTVLYIEISRAYSNYFGNYTLLVD